MEFKLYLRSSRVLCQLADAMFITNKLLTDVLYQFFVIMAPKFSGPMPRPLNWDEQDLHFVMQQWYVFEEVTPADVSEEGLEDHRIPFDDMTWEYFNGNNMGWW